MNKSMELFSKGQSIWYDNIQRSLLDSGTMAKWISEGKIYGVTSNPTIFNNAISKSSDYDQAIQPMAWAGLSSEKIFDELTIEDIRATTDLFLNLYHQTKGKDGFVSIEVNPLVAKDTKETIREAKRLWAAIDHPNLMVKIPATLEGLPAITETIACGINVNVTLIFSLDRYKAVMDAYMTGLEMRLSKRLPIEHIASVASFFVSRVDTKVDLMLTELGIRDQNPDKFGHLMGKAAIANAKLAYQLYLEFVNSKRFQALATTGVVHQRPLWASTSTKNPAYRDVIYVEELIGKNTVDTVPPQTLTALLDHLNTTERITSGVDDAKKLISDLESVGISMSKVTAMLEVDGVTSFSDAYQTCIKSIETRVAGFNKEPGPLLSETRARVGQLKDTKVVERLFRQDASLWTDDPVMQMDIVKRLGWLQLPHSSQRLIQDIKDFQETISQDGYDTVVLLGMGGSSLAPEMYARVFGKLNGTNLFVLDSTDPGQVRAISRKVNCKKTLFIVSSKSGGTAEVNAFLDYFWAKCKRSCVTDIGKHFAAITDPGTSLETTAKSRSFRKIFLADPTVGGRYSALTIFGLLPAGLIGVDLEMLLKSANKMLSGTKPLIDAERNPGLVLGALIGQAVLSKRDKLTVVCDKDYESFGDWLEQLVAESSGKSGRGILPVVGEKLQSVRFYQQDRLFVYLRNDGKFDKTFAKIKNAGFPVLTFPISEPYELGGEFFRWETAIAVACSIIRVNAFDQPDVQDNKTRTINKVNTFIETGSFAESDPIWTDGDRKVFASSGVKVTSKMTLNQIVKHFLAASQTGDYIAINAYLPYHKIIKKHISMLREYLMKETRMAVTAGFGPRFLHSTGQIHKGGANTGLFIQITADPEKDLKYNNLTFGTLERAQALGDFESLTSRGRRIIRIQINENELASTIKEIVQE